MQFCGGDDCVVSRGYSTVTGKWNLYPQLAHSISIIYCWEIRSRETNKMCFEVLLYIRRFSLFLLQPPPPDTVRRMKTTRKYIYRSNVRSNRSVMYEVMRRNVQSSCQLDAQFVVHRNASRNERNSTRSGFEHSPTHKKLRQFRKLRLEQKNNVARHVLKASHTPIWTNANAICSRICRLRTFCFCFFFFASFLHAAWQQQKQERIKNVTVAVSQSTDIKLIAHTLTLRPRRLLGPFQCDNQRRKWQCITHQATVAAYK